MNAFFASVEQAVNPALRGKPVLVCGEGRTIVTAASYEAKAFGVKTGMTPYEARKICPGAITVVGDGKTVRFTISKKDSLRIYSASFCRVHIFQ